MNRRCAPWWYKNNKYKLFKWKVRYYDNDKKAYFEDISYAIDNSSKKVLDFLKYYYSNYEKLEFKIVPSELNNSITCNDDHYDNSPSVVMISEEEFNKGFHANELPMPAEHNLDYILITNFWLHVKSEMCKYE